MRQFQQNWLRNIESFIFKTGQLFHDWEPNSHLCLRLRDFFAMGSHNLEYSFGQNI